MTAAAPPVDVPESAPSQARRRSPRSRVVVLVIVVVVLAGAGVATMWSLGARSAPMMVGGGWWSEEIQFATSEGLTESHTVFRCAPGRLEARVDLVANGPVPVTVTDVQLPTLDGILALDDRFVRTGTQRLRDPNATQTADLYDLVDFTVSRIDGSEMLRLVLTWEVRQCPAVDGYMIEDRMEITYTALGLTHSVTVPLGQPMALTSLPLDDLP